MKNTIKRFVREEQGAPAVEYALILGLVSIAAAVGMALLGTNVQNWYNNLATYIGTLQFQP